MCVGGGQGVTRHTGRSVTSVTSVTNSAAKHSDFTETSSLINFPLFAKLQMRSGDGRRHFLNNSTVPSFLWNIRKNNILKNIFYLNLDIVPELEHKQPRHKEGVCMLHDKYVNIWRVRTKFLSLLLLVVSVCLTAAWHQHCVRSRT